MLIYVILMIFTCCTGETNLGNYSPDVSPVVAKTNKRCICYNISGPSVADALHTDQQRLVVYLYKDANNNLKAYTPSREKQLLLPDFGLGKGDVFIDVGSESVQLHQLFNPKIAVELKSNNVVGAPNLNQYSSKGEINGDLFHYFNPKGEINNSNSELEDEPELEEEIYDDFINSNVSPPIPEIVDDSFLSEGLLDENSPTYPEKGVEWSTDMSFGEPHNPLLPYKGMPILGESDAGPVISSKDDLVSKPDLGLELLTIPEDDSLGTSPGEDQFSMEQTQPQDPLDSIEYEYFTFDKWFDQQMQKIQKTGKAPNKNLNLFSLKQQIEKTLYENGMYVTNDGVLIDSQGQALNVANLKLRPILIGHSVAYDSVFTVKNGKYILPSNLPYLEALLVTLVSPPKVLGVIPLGKTFVPRVSYRRNFDYMDLMASNKQASSGCKTVKCLQQQIKAVNDCKSGQCPLNKYFQMVYRRNHPKSSRFLFRTGNDKELAPKPAKPLSMKGLPRAHIIHGRKQANLKPQLPENKRNLFGFLNSMLDLNNNVKNYHRASSDYSRVSNEYDDVSEDKSPEEEDDGEEVPWFRIIGGNPATSSGTPVSSKGRSGFYGYF